MDRGWVKQIVIILNGVEISNIIELPLTISVPVNIFKRGDRGQNFQSVEASAFPQTQQYRENDGLGFLGHASMRNLLTLEAVQRYAGNQIVGGVFTSCNF